NAHNTPTASNAPQAQFLAPQTHQTAAKVGTEFSHILQEALTKPGIVNEAYRAFRNYSIGNQILAAIQLSAKGLPLSPIASFNAWKEKGRSVKKGEKAISLFMPVPVKSRAKSSAAAAIADSDDAQGGTFNVFMLRANWFSLDQTHGEDFAPEQVTPMWDAATAMAALDIREVRFDELLGNRLGYATADRTIAISPLNNLKHKTRFHELAHIVLGHTAEGDVIDGPETPRSLMEAEAESVAYILCTLLDLPGQAESRAYIQGWLAGAELPEKSAKKIFGAADKIMKAGQPITH
ncbi:ArdC-like ssDNA-binding domain-containing protein, partial [Variovorax sp. VaC1]|uniref:ArdC-like ssDNA-binding domain-containing protein n=1 Tax=Variovorax sp. VaC1 TaxID=3373132 RepID=UPI0037489ADD